MSALFIVVFLVPTIMAGSEAGVNRHFLNTEMNFKEQNLKAEEKKTGSARKIHCNVVDTV